MAKYLSDSVRKTINRIKDGEYFLPHIQRTFVWKEDQIIQFLDSILRGYPIGTFLFWLTKDELQMRRFTDNYKEAMSLAQLYVPPNLGKKTLVLDGQQRLQVLYIVLSGFYEGKELYFNVLSGAQVDEKGYKYKFAFLRRDDKRPPEWVLLRDIVLSEKTTPDLRRQIIERLSSQGLQISREQENLIDNNVGRVRKHFVEDEIINYYLIDSLEGEIKDYEEITEIFIRVNSGGTKLGKSDLMFSLMKVGWAEAEQEFEELLKNINLNGAFYFDKDFLLKTALTVIGAGAEYRVQKFRGEKGKQNLELIKMKWNELNSAIRWTVDFIKQKTCIGADPALPSYNALIPIIYYAYKKHSKIDSSENNKIFVWLYSALLNQVFTGHADTIINNCVDAVGQANATFPVEALNRKAKEQGRIVEIGERVLDSNIHLVLNTIYLKQGGIDFNPLYEGNLPQIDHIHSRSKMKAWKEFTSKVNDIGNLRFVSRDENLMKSDKDITKYFESEGKLLDIDIHCIPEDKELWKIENYPKFLEERRRLMLERIRKELSY